MTNDPKHTHAQQDAVPSTSVNEGRRKLTQAGLAAPVVIGTLASRRVLAQDAWNCTISGQVSGNISRPGKVTCSTLGRSPGHYAGLPPSAWPSKSDFVNNANNPRNFANTPNSQNPKFANAFERYNTSNGNTGNPTVLDVLQGDWDPSSINRTLRVRQNLGFDASRGIELGQEAIAAYMNAADATNGYPKFPIDRTQVVDMFNAVIHSGGRYDPTGVNWGIGDVITYFKSLHGS
ncbi:MAG TPA: hypothetical protein PKH69_11175 [Thiobacillaceae bacterium]|nr:hypothetical protein [Thiobacillaceae bacterium]HNU65030.1 hypothetical protein [Thiobacillaceae bacterium]